VLRLGDLLHELSRVLIAEMQLEMRGEVLGLNTGGGIWHLARAGRHHVDLMPRRKSGRFFQDEDDRQRWHGCSRASRLRRHDGDRRALPPVEETQEPNGLEDPEQAICTHRIPSQGGSLNTDSHSQCERQVAIETDPSFGAKGSLWCIWKAAPCSRRYGTSALGGAFDCSGVGMDGHRKSVLEMQRLKYAPVNPNREFAQNKVGSLGL
jgi:hypothetical protein